MALQENSEGLGIIDLLILVISTIASSYFIYQSLINPMVSVLEKIVIIGIAFIVVLLIYNDRITGKIINLEKQLEGINQKLNELEIKMSFEKRLVDLEHGLKKRSLK